MMKTIRSLHDTVFGTLEHHADRWALGIALRFIFLAVLLPYYLNSFMTKVGTGLGGLFRIQPGAYYQIVPQAVEAAGGDVTAISIFPYGLIVYLGTYMEALLPILIVLGLFTRLASVGMIGFILVQSLVDVLFHQVDAATIGNLFDRFPDAVILDQRLLWIGLLLPLVAKGGGALSIDRLIRLS